MRHVLLLVEGILHLCLVLPLLVLGSVGAITTQEEVGQEVGGCLERELESHAIDIVVGDDGVDWNEVNLVGLRSQFHRVLDHSREEELPEAA